VLPWGPLINDTARRYGLPHAFIEHSPDDVLHMKPRSIRATFFRRASSQAKAVFVVGQPMRDHLEQRLDCRNVVLINNGVVPPTDAQLSAPRPPELQGRLIILSAGNYYRKRGFVELVEAFALVAPAYPRAELRLVTTPPPDLVTRVAALNQRLGECIHIMGALPHDKLMQWMVWAACPHGRNRSASCMARRWPPELQ
jgi:glycosyltransferase involved in cell wall biosynthesis